MRWIRGRSRDLVRRPGNQDNRYAAPMSAIPRVAHPAKKWKAELREEAERAAAEKSRRLDPGGRI